MKPNLIKVSHLSENQVHPAYQFLTLQEKITLAQKLKKSNVPISTLAKQLGMDIRALQKYITLSKRELPLLFMPQSDKDRVERRNSKKDIIKKVKKLHSEGISLRKIATYLHLNRRTVKKYVETNLQAVVIQTRSSRTQKSNPYLEQIITSIRKGLSTKKIHDYLVAQGYTGSTSTTRHRVRELKKELNQKKKFSFFISRHKIIRLIFNPKPESTLATEHIEEIFNNYPLVCELLTLLYRFQKILTDRQAERFAEWIHQVEQLSFPELKSFINGIKRDLEAVFHACIYPFTAMV
ncbi:hypothetical protein [Bacillus cereus]|uniref:hypothetical protein n=1 Tax=Bacillus cereus TaxID=1396 RepID=UPI000BEB32D8|nr:hypothetical protein [Bacillus cereus]PEA01765.1 hypothetical protein CON37_26090 [Bacillus cereus]